MSLTKTPDVMKSFMARVNAGEKPSVIDASGCSCGICMGDLRNIGWAEKITTRTSMFWQYLGPNSIVVAGQEIKHNEYTKEIDMDWS